MSSIVVGRKQDAVAIKVAISNLGGPAIEKAWTKTSMLGCRRYAGTRKANSHPLVGMPRSSLVTAPVPGSISKQHLTLLCLLPHGGHDRLAPTYTPYLVMTLSTHH